MPHNKEQQARAGKKGGSTTKARHGKEHFRRVGQKGGQAVKEKHGAEHFKQAGKRGGTATASKPGVLRQAAARGGKATMQRLGKEHFQRIGAAGAKSRMEKAALGPRLLAALEPFRRYLEETEADFEMLQSRGLAHTEGGAPLHPSSCGVTFGACLALLQAMRAARPDSMGSVVAQSLDAISGFRVKVDESVPEGGMEIRTARPVGGPTDHLNKPFTPLSSRIYQELEATSRDPRDLTVELDPEAQAGGDE